MVSELGKISIEPEDGGDTEPTELMNPEIAFAEVHEIVTDSPVVIFDFESDKVQLGPGTGFTAIDV